MDLHQYFEYKEKGRTILFKRTIEDGLICFNCGKKYKKIIVHLRIKEACGGQIDIEQFKMQYNEYRRTKLLENQKARQKKYMTRNREELGNEEVKKYQNERKKRSIDKKREELGNEPIKKYQNERKKRCIDKKRTELGNELIKKCQNETKKRCIDKKRAELGNELVKKCQNETKKRCIDKKRAELGNKLVKKCQNEAHQRCIDKKRVELGPRQLKHQINERQTKSRKRRLEEDAETLKVQEEGRKRLSRKRLREEDYGKVKENQNKWQTKHRLINSRQKRLKKFRENTMYNAIFVCSCCHRKLFQSNVTKITQNFRDKIDLKKTGLLQKSIEEQQVEINGISNPYICHACKQHLLRGKMPSMSVNNGLYVHENTDPELQLTELEANLIAKNIVFMKIYQLPKSRWTALKDKVINVPVNDDDVLNTITQLPRTPNEAGLIEVDFKRKIEYENSHKKQIVNPKKCYKMLELLKRSKNRHYQFYDDYNVYQERCRLQNFNGYTMVSDENIEMINDLDTHVNEENVDEIIEKEYLTKDPVRKYQLKDYNKSLCLSNMFPEMSAPD